jgi:neutral ceramidase
VDAVRHEATARTGIPAEAIFLTATHTHSGPADLTQNADADFIRFLAGRMVHAIETAVRTARPATIRISTAELSGVSMNRRDPGGPVETRVRSIIAESTADRQTIAVLMNYACHPTVLEADSLAISPDFPGAAVSFVENATGGMAGYLQGCAGAINPVWIDHTEGEVMRIGSILGSVVVRQVFEGAGVGLVRRSVNLSSRRDLEAPPARLAGAKVTGPIWFDQEVARLPRRKIRNLQEIDAEISAWEHGSGSGTRAGADELHLGDARMAALQAERYLSGGAFRYWGGDQLSPSGEGTLEPVEIRALGFGTSLALIGIPGEPFLEIGESIRRRSDISNLLVCGYSNGTVGYLPTRRAFEHHGYEVGMARYAPNAASLIVNAGIALLGKAVG